MDNLHVFVDTSIFLHYRRFEEIDWPSTLSIKNVTLVVPPIVLSELNDKKDHAPSSAVKRRALGVLKQLEALWGQGNPASVRAGVNILFLEVEADLEYSRFQLDYRSQDDRLIASAIKFRDDNKQIQVAVVSADFGLRVKSKRHNLLPLSLPDDLKLAEEPDPESKRIKELERQLLEYKRSMPELKICFSDESTRLSHSRNRTTSREDSSDLGSIRELFPLIATETSQIINLPGGRQITIDNPLAKFARPSNEAIEQYNEKLNIFYAEFEKWRQLESEHWAWFAQLIRLDLIIANTGTTPAEDIDVSLHFPDGFLLYSESNLRSPPTQPSPPARPVSPLAGLTSRFPAPSIRDYEIRLPDTSVRNVSNLAIRRSNSYDVTCHVKTLKHGMSADLCTLFVDFEESETPRSFSISTSAHAANIPKETSGELHVIIT